MHTSYFALSVWLIQWRVWILMNSFTLWHAINLRYLLKMLCVMITSLKSSGGLWWWGLFLFIWDLLLLGYVSFVAYHNEIHANISNFLYKKWDLPCAKYPCVIVWIPECFAEFLNLHGKHLLRPLNKIKDWVLSAN